MNKEQSDKLFDDILKELPKNWIDIDKDKFSKVGNDIGYYQFVVNEEKAYFIFGGSEVLSKLLEVFVNSPYPKEIKKLYVGTFNMNLGDYNYEEAVKILSKGYFPNLEIFSIGFYDQLCNSGMYFYGELGDVTSLVKNMPNLKELELCGYFELNKPLEFKTLQKLTLWSESDCMKKDISQDTLNNFLLSSMPLLKHLEIFIDDKSSFVFPKEFLDGKTTPSCAFALELIQKKQIFIRYTTEYELLSLYFEKRYEQFRNFRETHLLILDEVGKRVLSDWQRVQLEELLSYRYNELLPTIYITNLPRRAFKEFLGERLADRLHENRLK